MLLGDLTLLIMMTFVVNGASKFVSMLRSRQSMMASSGLGAIENLLLRLKRGVPPIHEDGGSRATEIPPKTEHVPNTPPSPPVTATNATTAKATNDTTTTKTATNSPEKTTQANDTIVQTTNATTISEQTTLLHNTTHSAATSNDYSHRTYITVLPVLVTFQLLVTKMS